MNKNTKKRKELIKKIDIEKLYDLNEAIDLLKDASSANFNETIDIAINLSLNSSKSDQVVKGVINLPHGVGKKLKVAVIAKGEKAEEAKKSGAELVGDQDLIKTIESGKIDFDRLISTPDMMVEVAKLGKVLGPKGLMPNPKLGTVTNDISKAVKEATQGQLQFKNEKSGIIHAGVGKINFEKEQLIENIKTFIGIIIKNRPSGIKGNFIKKVSIASTMGLGIKLNVGNLQ